MLSPAGRELARNGPFALLDCYTARSEAHTFMFRQFAIVAIAVICFGHSLHADTLKDVRAALSSWQLKKVTLVRNSILVQTADKQIKLPQFAVMVASACAVLKDAKRISELHIVNFSGVYGFAFEEPAKNCQAVLNAPVAKLDIYVATSTHTLP
jgi:hypothetical protein